MTSLLNIAGNIPVVEAGGQSLRFEDGDSAYLSWTPASAGNRKTWTWSGWVKRGNISANQGIFGAESSGDRLVIGFGNSNSDQARFYSQSPAANIYTNAVFRDVSSWYHVVWAVDTTQSTAADRVKLYINGTQITSFASASYPSQNSDLAVNNTVTQYIGRWAGYAGEYLDGYLANVCMIDGQQLDPTSFGEYDDTLWKPKSDTDIQSLTFGTNGFYLPFKQTTEAEGFSTVTYTGTSSQQAIKGFGFEPDFIWTKARNNPSNHNLIDSVRGTNKLLLSDVTDAEYTQTIIDSFDSDGFTTSSAASGINLSGYTYVAWAWDAGSGSAVSNTDGSISSSVKANTANGFSIVSYTGGSSGTIGHGLGVAPSMIITKDRDSATQEWAVYHSSLSAGYSCFLNTTSAASNRPQDYTTTAPTSSVYSVGGGNPTSGLSDNYIAYCFAEISGYSKISSYSGTGATGNSITGLGFKPAFILVKRTDAANSWYLLDSTRNPTGDITQTLAADGSGAEGTQSTWMNLTADGFDIQTTSPAINASGGTYIYMAFADTRDATFFGDTSGNGNNWTPNALNNTDVVPDSPVSGGNFAVLNTIDKHSSAAISEGNLEIGTNTNAWYHQARATMFVNSGKWYWEVYQVGTGGFWKIGIRDNDAALTSNTTSSTGYEYYAADGNKHSSSGSSAYSSETSSQGNVYAFALDMDAGTITLYVNNVSQGTMFSGLSGYYAPTCSMYNSTIMFNFGQDSSFAGNETPQGNTDDNGQGDFYYAPPSGFLALTTGNLPAPTITAPDEYFNTVLYTGDGSAAQAINGVGFQPDWTWIKVRSVAGSNWLNDSVRGVTKILSSNLTNAESTVTNTLKSFDTDGFTVGDNAEFGGSGRTYVAWNWLAGNGTVSNTSGSVPSTVSANQTAGFSVVSWNHPNTNPETIGHGLSSAPEFIIIKSRDSSIGWFVGTDYLSSGWNQYLILNGTAAQDTASGVYNNTAPSSSVFTLGSYFSTNTANDDMIAYCFHSVEGYSKIGSYTGNGSTDGTFVHCGFRPAFVMLKVSSTTENWVIFDNERSEYNLSQLGLYPNTSGSEVTISTNGIDMLSNGFKLKGTGSRTNGSGNTYIFLAFAEAPFKSANAR